MREDDSDWFARWEEELPSPEELMPLSQSMISPDLALAFDIRSPGHENGNSGQPHHHQSTPPTPSQLQLQSSQANSSAEFAADSADLGSGAAGDEPARTLIAKLGKETQKTRRRSAVDGVAARFLPMVSCRVSSPVLSVKQMDS